MQQNSKIKGFEKAKLIIILALLSSLAPLSTDMYLPALESVRINLNTNTFLTQLSIASFFIAFALGQLIYGPLSDIFGRRKPILVGIGLFIISSIFCVIIDDIYAFITLRFFEALGGCAGVVIARAVVNDLFNIKEAAGIYAMMMVVSSLAPMLSPFFGSLLLKYYSWHSIFTFLFILGILLFLMVIFGLKESAPNLKNKHFSTTQTIKNYKFVLSDLKFINYVFSAGFALAAMFAYITGSSFVFTNFFKLSELEFGILFGVNALGFMIFANINAFLVRYFDSEKILSCGLFVMLIFSCILIFVAKFTPNFWAFEITLFISISMLGFIAPNSAALAMARFKECSGAASAVLGTAHFSLAGLVSFLAGFLDATTPIMMAFVMVICVFIGNLIYFYLKFKA